MPYYALSNLLTLFSHDMPTLALIQHTFDYLFVRTPVACVYIAAAVCLFSSTHFTSHFYMQMVLSRKEEVTWLAAVGEEGMLHSILSGLPILYEEGEEGVPPLPAPDSEAAQVTKAEDVTGTVDEKIKVHPLPNGDHVPESTAKPEEPSIAEPVLSTSTLNQRLSCDKREAVVRHPLPTRSPSTASGDIDVVGNPFTPSSDLSAMEADRTALNGEPLEDGSPTSTENDTTLADELIIKGESEDTKPAPTLTSTPPSKPELEASEPWPDALGQPTKARMSLSSLLRQADDLFARFPPSHQKLDLDKIMGPRSTIFTWTESSSFLPPDDELEQYVKTPGLVVLPYLDPLEEAIMKEKEEREQETRKVERRKKLRKNIFARTNGQKKAVFAGAVLALGVAVAVYGIRSPGDAGRGHQRGDLKRLFRYIGGLLLTGGDKFVGRLLGH